MKQSNKFQLLASFILFLSACKPDPLVGPQGPSGSDGQDGNANVDYYSFSLNLSAFHHYTSSHIWGEPGPSYLPNIASDQAALVYIFLDPVDGSGAWVQQPFVHYFNSGNTTNTFTHGIDTGRLWFFIRNSTGGQPYSTMSGSLIYKVFIIESSQLREMENDGVALDDLTSAAAYMEEHEMIPLGTSISIGNGTIHAK